MSQEFNKQEYKNFKREAKELGIYTASSGEGQFDNHNGVTVAFVPMTDSSDCKMIAVAVSYCSTEDVFLKKVGKYHALRKHLWEGQFVQLPLGQFLREHGSKVTGSLLVNLFSEI